MPFAEWEIQDENGVGTGAYYSPRTLSQTLGGGIGCWVKQTKKCLKEYDIIFKMI